MRPFEYADNRVMLLLSLYISEGYFFPDIFHKDKKFFRVTPRVINRYTFEWDEYSNQVVKEKLHHKIIVPRYIDTTRNNTKLEAILFYGFRVFELLADLEYKAEHPFSYLMMYVFQKRKITEVDRALLKFFKFLQIANHKFIATYKKCEGSPTFLDEMDDTYILYQSHILLVSSLFELYHPIEIE